ncbi:M3 family metallopeptidase [Shigella flexneri]
MLLWDDVITLFHEFGHTLHGLFAASVMPWLFRHQHAA